MGTEYVDSSRHGGSNPNRIVTDDVSWPLNDGGKVSLAIGL
jgi:hypothetical protein